MDRMADILASATLLVTALTLVYTSWTPAIEAVANGRLGTTAQERANQRAAARMVLWRRAVPIAAACWVTLLLFVPRDFGIVATTLRCWCSGGCVYDDISSVFLLTQLVVAALALHASGQGLAVSAFIRRAN